MAGLYIHIPYCVRKCAYCDFVSAPSPEGVPDAYIDALIDEARRAAEEWRRTVFGTVFIGGGTPTLLEPRQILRLGEALPALFCIDENVEFTVECNPGTVSAEKLAAWKTIGVNRLSVGLQSSDDGLLCVIGRIHKKDDFVKTVALAKEAGFSDINADIMYGLPGQMQEQYLETLRFAAEQGVTHVSAYSLILEEGTPLEHMVMQGKAVLPNEDAVADMEDAGRELLCSLGYERYEISNYAKPGHRCRHNVNYWENGEWLGLGAAAHSAKGTGGVRVRAANTEDIQAYIRGENERTEEKLTRRDEIFETVMLGLRMTNGLLLRDFENRFGSSLECACPGRIAELKRNGWLNEYAYASGRLALNERGLDFENAAVLLFMEEQEDVHE